MGQAMVLNLLEKGIDVVIYNRTRGKTDRLEKKAETLRHTGSGRLTRSRSHDSPGVERAGNLYKAYTIKDLVKQLGPPRIIWLMVPHGDPVDQVIEKLVGNTKVSREIHLGGVLGRTPRDIPQDTHLQDTHFVPGDIIIDGGNSFFKDSIRRYKKLKKLGIHFLDVGTSGGLEGARHGACLMVGGDREIYKRAELILKLIAVEGGLAYFGPSGAGHFVKMVHNGVEYGMLQALGEGFEVLAKSPYELDLREVAENWQKGSVVRGWLIELLGRALRKDKRNEWLGGIKGVVGGGETGRWTIETAKELGVSTPVINESLKARKRSQSKPSFASKIIAILRNQFGGHEVEKASSF